MHINREGQGDRQTDIQDRQTRREKGREID